MIQSVKTNASKYISLINLVANKTYDHIIIFCAWLWRNQDVDCILFWPESWKIHVGFRIEAPCRRRRRRTRIKRRKLHVAAQPKTPGELGSRWPRPHLPFFTTASNLSAALRRKTRHEMCAAPRTSANHSEMHLAQGNKTKLTRKNTQISMMNITRHRHQNSPQTSSTFKHLKEMLFWVLNAHPSTNYAHMGLFSVVV